MAIRAILFDAPGVIYERPIIGVGLQTLLEHYGLKPRHPTLVRTALRAAEYDANLGRIKLDDYYDALLRFHGLTDERALAAGREALRFDASRLTLNSSTVSTLRQLDQQEIRLGAIANSPYQAADEVSWLERMGIPPATWTMYMTSCEAGMLLPDPKLIGDAVQRLAVPSGDTLLVSRESDCLEIAAGQGMHPVAFQPSAPVPFTWWHIEQMDELTTRLVRIG
jgi:beta-phosphoglucomutase-like phosphatase (HAD superfamily)